LPQVPDCVVIAVPRERVEDAVRDCAEAGAGGAAIYASGFAEVDEPQWQETQRRLSRIARESGLRIVGPNTAGFSHHRLRMPLTYTSGMALFCGPCTAVGIVSQSGGIANGMTEAGQCGVTISHTLSSGNACDVDVADLVAYLAE